MAKTSFIGVAWDNRMPDGTRYISVIITNPFGPDYKFTLYENDKKQSSQSPDYSVRKTNETAPEQGQPPARRSFNDTPPPAKNQRREDPPNEPESSGPGGVADDDVPF
jgi:hypothetical protein